MWFPPIRFRFPLAYEYVARARMREISGNIKTSTSAYKKKYFPSKSIVLNRNTT